MPAIQNDRSAASAESRSTNLAGTRHAPEISRAAVGRALRLCPAPSEGRRLGDAIANLGKHANYAIDAGRAKRRRVAAGAPGRPTDARAQYAQISSATPTTIT